MLATIQTVLTGKVAANIPATLAVLDGETAQRYAHLRLFAANASGRSADDVIAIGAGVFSRPVGLGVLHVSRQDAATVGYIASLFVEPEQRRKGIGSALLAALEEEARERGCGEVHITYPAPGEQELPLDSFLTHHEWDPATTDRILFKVRWKARVPGGDGESVELDRYFSAESSWIREPHRMPVGMRLVPWQELSEADVARVFRLRETDPRYRHALITKGLPVDPLASVALVAGEEVTGWVLERRLSTDTAVWDHLWVRRDMLRLGHVGIGQALLAESLKRCYEGGIAAGYFATDPANSHMLRFVRRNLAHIVHATSELRVRRKSLHVDG